MIAFIAKKACEFEKEPHAAELHETPAHQTAMNQTCAMDFMHDELADGAKIWLLTILDIFSRESVALDFDYRFKAPQVVDVLKRVFAERGKPQRMRCDNGPEVVSLHVDQWAH